MNKPPAVVVNPQSGGGKTGSAWPGIQRILESRLGKIETRFTEYPGHGIALARDLALAGHPLIIAAGGDGTINEAGNGILASGAKPDDLALAVLPIGTGGDFRRTLDIPKSFEAAAARIAEGRRKTIDTGLATYRNRAGVREQRSFLNLTSFGMGGEVAARARNFFSRFGGSAAFFYATFEVFLKYPGKLVHLKIDGQPEAFPFEITNVAIGNGRFHGGGMHVCPLALLDSGALEVTVIEHLNMLELVRDIRVLYSDNLYVHPKTRHFRARSLVAESPVETRIELDGEPVGSLPMEVSVQPASLSVLH